MHLLRRYSQLLLEFSLRCPLHPHTFPLQLLSTVQWMTATCVCETLGKRNLFSCSLLQQQFAVRVEQKDTEGPVQLAGCYVHIQVTVFLRVRADSLVLLIHKNALLREQLHLGSIQMGQVHSHADIQSIGLLQESLIFLPSLHQTAQVVLIFGSLRFYMYSISRPYPDSRLARCTHLVSRSSFGHVIKHFVSTWISPGGGGRRRKVCSAIYFNPLFVAVYINTKYGGIILRVFQYPSRELMIFSQCSCLFLGSRLWLPKGMV